MKNVFGWKKGRIFIVTLLLAIGLNKLMQYEANRVYADTTGWIDSAIDAKDTATISSDLAKAKQGLIKWHATSGNAYLLFGTPASDMAQVENNLDSYSKQATALSHLSPTSQEYIAGVADLNTSFSSMYLYADDYWLRHQGIGLYAAAEIAAFAAWVSLLCMLVVYYIIIAKRRAGTIVPK